MAPSPSRLRNALIGVAVTVFWALLIGDSAGLLFGPPVDWTPVARMIAGAVPWLLSLAVLYAFYRGWNWVVAHCAGSSQQFAGAGGAAFEPRVFEPAAIDQ